MSGPLSLSDDTIEFDVDQPPGRPLGLMIGIGVLTLLVLVGLGYLILGSLTGDGSRVGLGGSGGPTAVVGPPSDSPSPEVTDPTTPIPVDATTPATTPAVKPSHTPTPPPSTSTVAVSLAVGNGVMRPQSYTGPDCPRSTLAQATVVASGPVTITYHWYYVINGRPGATPSAGFQFTAAGSHPFSYLFSDLAMPSGKVTATFVVTAPVTKRASMQYTQLCGASAAPIKVSGVKPQCPMSVTFSTTLSAGVAPMTVTYHWRIRGPIVPLQSGHWDVKVAGTHDVHTAPIPLSKTGPSTGSSVEVTLVIDGPVHFETDPVTVSCP